MFVWQRLFLPTYFTVQFIFTIIISLYFLVLFMGPTVLFQLTFTFIYSTLSVRLRSAYFTESENIWLKIL